MPRRSDDDSHLHTADNLVESVIPGVCGILDRNKITLHQVLHKTGFYNPRRMKNTQLGQRSENYES